MHQPEYGLLKRKNVPRLKTYRVFGHENNKPSVDQSAHSLPIQLIVS